MGLQQTPKEKLQSQVPARERTVRGEGSASACSAMSCLTPPASPHRLPLPLHTLSLLFCWFSCSSLSSSANLAMSCRLYSSSSATNARSRASRWCRISSFACTYHGKAGVMVSGKNKHRGTRKEICVRVARESERDGAASLQLPARARGSKYNGIRNDQAQGYRKNSMHRGCQRRRARW